MAIYTLADTHLSQTVNKPMDIFGSRWDDSTNKIIDGWKSVVGDGDTVVMPGDISWGINLDEAAEDMRLIDSLPGRKLIGTGNHDSSA